MFVRSPPRVRWLIVMMFMAICGLLSTQNAMASVDRVQHGLDIAHAASAVAGAVIAEDHAASIVDDHEHDRQADSDADEDHAPSHQHGAENSQLSGPHVPSLAGVYGRASPGTSGFGTVFLGGLSGSSLERPPRG